jgi:nucleoside-diphosphate kinase
MTISKTCGIIKPDAVKRNLSGDIISFIEKNGICINQMRKINLSKELARKFYAIHSEQKWFNELIDFMTSGPIIVMELECQESVIQWRSLMGATNPLLSNRGTIRRMWGASIGENCVHGSDSEENARIELSFFF